MWRLEGLNKTETEHKYGADKVLVCRKSDDTSPPNGESLKDTYKSVVPYYEKAIEPQLNSDKNILVVAHGNSLRTLMMYLDGCGAIEISEVNIATGIPRVYEFSPGLKLETADYLEE